MIPSAEETTLESADGTTLLGVTRLGSGPPLVMVPGVMACRDKPQQPGLAEALSSRWEVYTYDRRGTGRSGTAEPYRVEQEFEDLRSLLDAAGPDALVYGFSSGATLALLAARAGVPMHRLVAVEPPLAPDDGGTLFAEAEKRLGRDKAAARRWFDEHVTGIPAHILESFPPPTDQDLANTPTMLHELTFLPGTSGEMFAEVQVPTLVVASDQTAPVLLESAKQIVEAMPRATLRILPGHWHGVPQEALVEQIREFDTGPDAEGW